MSRASLLPQGAFDTHVHIFDPSLGPYSPGSATYGSLLSFSKSISLVDEPANLVIVQPSPYGTDNHILLSLLRQHQNTRACIRGIAVANLDKVTDGELANMHSLGVRGLRLNLQAGGHGVDVAALEVRLRKAAEKIRHLPGWKLQLFIPAHVWDCKIDFRSTVIRGLLQLTHDTVQICIPQSLIYPWL